MKRYCYICHYETDDETLVICPECLCDDVFVKSKDEEELLRLSGDRSFTNAMMELKEKDSIEYQLKLQQFKNTKEQAVIIEQKKQESSKLQENNTLTCPKCGSTEITEGTKGFTLFKGFIGSSDFRYVCKKCGNKWKPGSMLEILQRANNHN